MARTKEGSTLDSTCAVLGLRQNLPQFMLLVAVNALVGGTLGQERKWSVALGGEQGDT